VYNYTDEMIDSFIGFVAVCKLVEKQTGPPVTIVTDY